MIIEVKVPSVGESVTSGVVSAWHKKSGEFVNEGEPLFALETDKVSTDIVAEKSGVLETKVPQGQEVKIGEVVAIIDDSKQGAKQEKEEQPQKAQPEEKKKKTGLQKKPDAVPASVDGGSQRLQLQLFRLQFSGLWKKKSLSRKRSPGRVRAVG